MLWLAIFSGTHVDFKNVLFNDLHIDDFAHKHLRVLPVHLPLHGAIHCGFNAWSCCLMLQCLYSLPHLSRVFFLGRQY